MSFMICPGVMYGLCVKGGEKDRWKEKEREREGERGKQRAI